MTIGLRFFYRHIFVTGFQNIPAKGPAIIIANHNSSLMDAALLGILLKRKAFFFARGDVFVNKPVKTLLWWLHMMPVHSYHGGRKTLNANKNSFSDGQKILEKGGIIVFFPESTSHIEHQLLPFRKGVFRLAFDTANAGKHSYNIPVVPVGLTYDNPVAGRINVQVHAGKPLILADYKNEYHANPAVGLLQICKDAQQSVLNLVLHVIDNTRLQTAEQCLTICRNNNLPVDAAWKIISAKQLEREKAACHLINNATEQQFEIKQQQANNYFNALSATGITDKTLVKNAPIAGWKKILLLIGFPFYIAGLLLNGLPVLIARNIADNKVYRNDFYSWIFVALYTFIYLIWLAVLITICWLFGWKYVAGLLPVLILTGLFAYVYKDWIIENDQYKKWKALSTEKLQALMALRNCV